MKKTIALAYWLENFQLFGNDLRDAFRELQKSNGIFISKADPEELEKVKFFLIDSLIEMELLRNFYWITIGLLSSMWDWLFWLIENSSMDSLNI